MDNRTNLAAATLAMAGMAAVGIVGGVAGPANADLYKFTFGGEVGWLQGDVPAPWNEVAIGSHCEISYIFDSEAEDQHGSQYIGSYDLISAEIVVDGVSQATSVGNIRVNVDQQWYRAYFDDLPIGAAAYVQLWGYPWTFETDELPLTLDLGVFPSRLFHAGGKYPEEWEFTGIVDTFSSEIVPAPAVSVALCVGLLTCAGRRRRE